MDKRVLRERMRRKQQQLRRRRMMKRITCVVAAILLLVFVVRGVILPIVNHAGGGSNKDAETVNVQANTAGVSTDSSTKDGTASTDTAASDTDSADSGTDATVMPVKGSAAGERLSVMTPGWHEDSTGKWYQNPDGTYYVNGFADIDGTTYSFDKKGYMQTGWVEKGVKDYYFNEDGSYDPSKKRPMIALTFDDGPGEYTSKLLDILSKYNVKATFFTVGSGHPDLLKAEADAGHSIGIHSATHDYSKIYASEDAFFADLRKQQDTIENATGIRTTLVRFPGGSSNTVSKSYCSGIMTKLTKDLTDMGYQYFDWNVTSGDAGETTSTSVVVQNVISGIQQHDVSIVLQHDIKGFSVNAVEQIIQWGLAHGYTFLPLTAESPTAHHGVNN